MAKLTAETDTLTETPVGGQASKMAGEGVIRWNEEVQLDSSYRRRPRRTGLRVLLVLLLLLVAIRLALPWVVQNRLEAALAADGRYVAAVDDVDLKLWRGAYQVEGIRIRHAGAPEGEPDWVRIRSLDLSLAWGSLFRGTVVAEAALRQPVLHLRPEAEEAEEAADERHWMERLQTFLPFRLDRIAVHEGTLEWAGRADTTVSITDIEAVARNVANSRQLASAQPAVLELRGKVMESGSLRVNATMNPFSAAPTFSLDLRATDLALAELSPFLRGFGNLDVEGGTLDLFGQVESADGAYGGFVRPVFEDVRAFRLREDAPAGRLQRWLEQRGLRLPEISTPERARAARIEVAGRFEQPYPGLTEAMATVAIETITRALVGGLEREVRRALEEAT